MTLAPLLDAAPIIRLHAAFAFAAIGLGAVQLLAPKGTLPHRTIGWAWAILMSLVAGTSLFIHTIEERQGLKIACPEEIAYRQGYIDAAQLRRLAERIGKSSYANYLNRMLEEIVY